MEQIASIRSGIASEIEEKILNVLAFVLSINDLIQIINNIIQYMVGHSVKGEAMCGDAALLIVILTRIRINKNRLLFGKEKK